MPPSSTGSDAPDPRLPGQGLRARGQHASHDHRPLRRVLTVVAASVAALLVVAVGAGAVAYHRLQSNIDAQSIDGLLGTNRPTDEVVDPTTGNSAVNILVLGSDTRALADGTGDEYGGEAADPGARSDSTVLVHLAADRRSAAIISIPRDSMVQIPDCTTNENKTIAAHLGMFNSAYSEAGAACSVKTVEQLTQVRIDHYAVVDFSGFQQMVDALGGVTICTPEAINDTKANLHLTAGTHDDVDGATALAYARVRYTVGDGSDISRIGRQQALMSSMFQKVTSAGILTRPDKLYSFLDAATKSVTADPDLANLGDSLKLAQSLQKLPASGVKFITVPTEPYPKNTARVQWTDAAETLWQEVSADTLGASETPTATTTANPDDSSALSVAPSSVAVNVVNVGAPAGTAASMADQLRAVGFDVKSTGDGQATQPGQAAVIRYGSSRADSARTLAAALPSAKLIEDETLGSSITLEVSQADISVTDVRSRVIATSTPTPSATITSRVATDDICA